MAAAAELAADLDEHDLDALLGKGERQHAAGDAAADDEDSPNLGGDLRLGHGSS